jgi:hypothetical protein
MNTMMAGTTQKHEQEPADLTASHQHLNHTEHPVVKKQGLVHTLQSMLDIKQTMKVHGTEVHRTYSVHCLGGLFGSCQLFASPFTLDDASGAGTASISTSFGGSLRQRIAVAVGSLSLNVGLSLDTDTATRDGERQ